MLCTESMFWVIMSDILRFGKFCQNQEQIYKEGGGLRKKIV